MAGSEIGRDPYDAVLEVAYQFGKPLKVKTSGVNELFIDIDEPEQLAQYERMWPMLKQHVPEAEEISRTRSKSGTGWHIVVTLGAHELTQELRTALQAALGSDPTREMLAALYLLTKPADVKYNLSVFFELAPEDEAILQGLAQVL